MAETNQLNLTVVALVALVAIVGLVALVMNAATIAKFPISTGSQQVAAQVPPTPDAAPANAAGSAFSVPVFDATCYKACMASHVGQESIFQSICRRDCMVGSQEPVNDANMVGQATGRQAIYNACRQFYSASKCGNAVTAALS